MPATNELLQEGRYRIDHPSTHIGEEKIFEAYDTVRNTNVIVREIPVKLNKVATVSQRESLRLAFATQAKALTEIEHDSLLKVKDFFSEIDRQYLVMEAVEGDNLRDLVESRKRPFTISEVTNWADELLDALNYLHTRRPAIIHRNINPAKVRLHPSGKIKLAGVGVENGTDSEFSSAAADSDNLRYSPMEQIWPGLDPASQKVITNSYDDRSERILKQPLDERSDIYSLGATLYYLITGVEPVDPIERSIDILEGKLDPLREPTKVDSQIPPEISDVLMKALEIKRENRYDSAVIMRQVLKTAITRVAEREQEENREQSAAAETVRAAEQSRIESAAAAAAAAEEARRKADAEAEEKRRAAEAEQKRLQTEAEQKRLQAEAEQKRLAAEAEEKRRAAEAQAEQERQRELMQRQLREAEEQRLAAERSAEAERLLQENQDASKEQDTKVPDESHSEIHVSAEVVAYRDSAESKEEELAAVLRELEEVETGQQSQAAAESSSEEVIEFDAPVDLGPQDAESNAPVEHDDDDEVFSISERPSSLPMPAIFGAVGLVLVIAIGGWFAMSGTSEPPKREAVTPVQVAEPAPVQPDPAEVIVSSQTDTNSAPAEAPVEQSAAANRTAAAPAKAKKTETAKAADKKKVTVDDLINDN